MRSRRSLRPRLERPLLHREEPPGDVSVPLWSFLGDMKMYALMWRGEMTAEAERLGYGEPAAAGTAVGHPVS